MRTGSNALWRLVELADSVPAPPDSALAALLASWWNGHRHYGCTAAREARTGVIVAPDPSLFCPDCAMRRFKDETRCCYCHGRVRPGRANELVFEMSGGVSLLGRAHRHCTEQAGRESR